MESQRNILLIGLLFVSFLLWQQWQADKAPKPVATESSVVANATTNHSADVPEADTGVPAALTATQNLITVKTDQLDVQINPVGGDIVFAARFHTNWNRVKTSHLFCLSKPKISPISLRVA